MGQKQESAPTCPALETFLAGQAVRAYDYLGAHPEVRDGTEGYVFRVWAPTLRRWGLWAISTAGTTRITP